MYQLRFRELALLMAVVVQKLERLALASVRVVLFAAARAD